MITGFLQKLWSRFAAPSGAGPADEGDDWGLQLARAAAADYGSLADQLFLAGRVFEDGKMIRVYRPAVIGASLVVRIDEQSRSVIEVRYFPGR